MGRDAAALRAVDRLDGAVGAAVAGLDEPVMAFSGGLGSLIVAALARKRGDLRCVVVGFPGSSDVQAAKVAQLFLDYRIEVLRPSRAQTFRKARAIAAAHPGLPIPEVLALLPLALVEDRHGPAPVLSGFGLTVRGSAMRDALRPRGLHCPGIGLRPEPSTRASLVRMALALGLPESFALAAPHTPVEGSGIGPALRALAHREHISLPRLLAMPWTRF